MTASERIANMTGRTTLYELAMTKGDEKILVCYSQRKGRQGIWKGVTHAGRVHKIIARTGTESIHYAKLTADGATMGAWTINFTGRTQRDAISQGELPYIGDDR